MTAKVAINGYGTVGKRVADAVAAQKDMEIVGVTKTRPTFEARLAGTRGYPLYAASADHVAGFKAAGLDVHGTLDDLLQEADIVVDGTPKRSDYKPVYEKAGVKGVWQGGEKHDLTGFSFNSLANYDEALGRDFTRVVSCNTTGLIRTLVPVAREIGIRRAHAVMVRRSADPWDIKRGPINAIVPELKMPSHHGPDVQSVVPTLPIHTVAVKVPTTIMHLHSLIVDLEREAAPDEVVGIWRQTPRVKLVKGAEGVQSTAQVMEMAKDLGRTRSDLYEVAVWEDGVNVAGDTLYYFQAIHQESDIIPENVDAIRAMLELESDGMKSIAMTDEAMGIA